MLTGFGVGSTVVTPILMIRAFPAPVRFSGVSLSYNIGYALFGGVTPVIVSFLLHFHPLASALYVAATAVLGLCGVFIAPRRELFDDDASATSGEN